MLLTSLSRRTFFSGLLVGIPILALAQRAIIEGKEAVVCESDSVKCPNGHASCKSINAPIVVGNDNREYPDTAQLFGFHLMRCDVCKVLFTRE